MAESANPESKPRVGFGKAIKQGFSGYVRFSGRATRAEYWWWILFVFLGVWGLSIVDGIIRAATGSNIFGVFQFLFSLAVLLPDLAVTARRLHDIGKAGWWQAVWYLLPLLAAGTFAILWSGDLDSAVAGGADLGWARLAFTLAIIVSIIAFILNLGMTVWWVLWMVRQGEPGPNRFGPDPRAWDSPEATEVF